MQKHFFLKCGSCGAPAADCVRLCPYCGKSTGFASIGLADGIARMDGGGFEIANGAEVDIGASKKVRECPFCGAEAETAARFCPYCNTKIVIEKMRVARLVIKDGGKLHIGRGGQLEVVGRRKRALHEAAERGDLDAVRSEIDDGDDPDFPDEHGRRPMHYAALGGHLDVAKWLVSIGADADIEDDEGLRPIHLAVADAMPSFLRSMGAKPREHRPKKKKRKKGPSLGGDARISRHVFDADGRRVVVGTALDDAGVEIGLWCEASGARAWTIPKDELPEIEHIETNRQRSHAWVGDESERVQVELATGRLVARSNEELASWTLAADGTLLGVRDSGLVRFGPDGEELPVWTPPRRSTRIAKLAAHLPGIGGLVVSDALGPRPTRLRSVRRLLAQPDGGLSALRDLGDGFEWIRFGADGAITHHVEVPGRRVTDVALDASGRLWAHVEHDGHALVLIDPGRPSAEVLARSKHRRAFGGFAIAPGGELSLCRGTPQDGGGTLPVRARRDWRRLAATTALALLVVAQLVSAAWAVWRRLEVEEIIARGGEIDVTSRGSHTIFDATALAEIVPSLGIQLAMCIVSAIGLVTLVVVARAHALAAMGLALSWCLVVGVVTAALYGLAGSPDVFMISTPPMVIHGASIVVAYLLTLRLRL